MLLWGADVLNYPCSPTSGPRWCRSVAFALLAAGVRGRILAGLALAAVLGTTLVLTSGC